MLSNGDQGLHPSFFIERVPTDKWLQRKLGEWRALRTDGWDVVVLLDLSDRKTVIAFGLKRDEDPTSDG